eukprot:9739745-Prorocentrum_lima.AAC.1
MTSSLVGSEMCIRDRQDAISELLTRSQYHGKKHTFEIIAIQLLPRKESVSYTHLTLPTICSV